MTLAAQLNPVAWRFVCPRCEAILHVVEGLETSPQPAEPTQAQVGSEAKLGVMRERFKRGESLFHAGDNVRLERRVTARARNATPGVQYNERRRRWQVRLNVPGVEGLTYVGCFADEATACRAAGLARAGKLDEAVALAQGRRLHREAQ
jgi:hypothetical protein